jgi:hypothetical protein
MVDPNNVVELEDVTTLAIESLILRRVEEETLTATQGEMGQISANPNGSINPNPKTSTKP